MVNQARANWICLCDYLLHVWLLPCMGESSGAGLLPWLRSGRLSVAVQICRYTHSMVASFSICAWLALGHDCTPHYQVGNRTLVDYRTRSLTQFCRDDEFTIVDSQSLDAQRSPPGPPC